MAMTPLTCPDGRVNDPAHFINLVDRNCVPYTLVEWFLFAGGCLMWVVAYALIIRNARKTQVMDMAVFAGCSNFAWEFLWSFAFRTDMGFFMVYTYRAWFFLDIYIFWLLLKYGHKECRTPFIIQHFKSVTLIALAFCTVIYYFFTHEGHDTFIGANSAYIAQLFISALCLIRLLNASHLHGLSFTVAWLRSFGTGANTVFMFLHYPDQHWLHSMGVISFLLDMAYLGVYLKMKKTASATP